MKNLPAQGMIMGLIYANVKTERKKIIADIEGMKLGQVEDQFDTGYNDGLDDVITMLLAENEDEP